MSTSVVNSTVQSVSLGNQLEPAVYHSLPVQSNCIYLALLSLSLGAAQP